MLFQTVRDRKIWSTSVRTSQPAMNGKMERSPSATQSGPNRLVVETGSLRPRGKTGDGEYNETGHAGPGYAMAEFSKIRCRG